MTRLSIQLHTDESGQIALTVLLTFIVAFIIAAIALDAGVWYFDHRRAQNQVEAAAQAAVLELPDSDASNAADIAQEWMTKNGGGTLDELCPLPASAAGATSQSFPGMVFWDRDDDGEFDTVRVCERRDTAVILSGLANVTGAKVSAIATATLNLIPAPYALMAMDATDCQSLDVSGEAVVTLEPADPLVPGGDSYTASTCTPNALNVRGNGEFTGNKHDVCGDYRVDGNGVLSGDIGDLCNLPDPWAGVDPPSGAASCTVLPVFNQPGQNGTSANEIDAGTYCHLQVEGNGTEVILTGGEYIFTQGVTVAGNNTSLLAPNQTLVYMTCTTYPNPCNGSVPAPFDIKGGADDLLKLVLTGHDAYEHIALYVDRTAGESVCVTITGQGNVLIDGSVYSFGCTTDMGGQGDADFEINGTIIADNIIFRGQAEYIVEWDPVTAPKFTQPALIE